MLSPFYYGIGVKSFIWNSDFDIYYKEFVKFGFIKDWDFYCYGVDDIVSENTLEQYTMTLEGKKIKVIRYKTIHERLLFDNLPLIELAIHEKEQLSDMEIPLTCIKFSITINNLDIVFDVIDMFYTNSINKNILIKLFESIEFIQYESNQYGLFSVDFNIFDDGMLSCKFIEILKDYTIDEQQFIISHMKQPDRLFARLIQKNIPKSNNILKLVNLIEIDRYKFILDEQFIDKLIWRFYRDFKKTVDDIFLPFNYKLIEKYSRIDNYNEFGDFLNYYNENIKNGYCYENITLDIDGILKCCNIDEIHKILSVYEGKLVDDLMKIKRFEALVDKIKQLKYKIKVYDKYIEFNRNVTVNDIKIMINYNNKLVMNGFDDIKLLYMDIWKAYDELFRGINIGRLTEIINKDVFVNECVKFIFGDMVKQLRFKYMKCDNEFYNIVVFFMKIVKLNL